MKMFVAVLCASLMVASLAHGAEKEWYKGDERCPTPRDDGTYSAPYNALDHRQEYPAFDGADKPGWSCSYPREDGVIVQYGDSRTPQQQWLDLWGTNSND
ncbi:MAG: hypothetical protein A2076_00670 [Geobacteraceae bacterium GWC2_53_11]|nr:MAG: hypothetical protein A2076_00670 [Geobacteraceae bacterium GWC2_53_11]